MTKLNPKDIHSDNLIPWYEFSIHNIFMKNIRLVIGHWSTLGFQNKSNIISIDTGCAWGNKLTAVKISRKKDIEKYEVSC